MGLVSTGADKALASLLWLDHVRDKRLPGLLGGSPGNYLSWLSDTHPTISLWLLAEAEELGLCASSPQASAMQEKSPQRYEHPHNSASHFAPLFPRQCLWWAGLSPSLGCRALYMSRQAL